MKKENAYLALGLLLGSVIGTATGKMGLWLSFGLLLGLGIRRVSLSKTNSGEGDPENKK